MYTATHIKENDMGMLKGSRDSKESKELNDASHNNGGFQIFMALGAVLAIIGVVFGIINSIF